MLSQSVLYVCIVLEGLLLVRAARSNLLKKFPLFYFYIAFVMLRDLFGTPIYMHYRSFYGSFYWATALLAAAVSYGVLMEIYSRSLKNYPGAARFFRVLLFVMFLAIATLVAVSSLSAAQPSAIRAIGLMDRNLRQLQAVLLICLLALLAYYKIPMGKNLRGVVLGYALFIGANVITLTFITHPAAGLAPFMRMIEPLFYMVTLLIWSVTLWAPSAEVVSGVPCGIEEDYERLARETRMIILRARTHLARAGRP